MSTSFVDIIGWFGFLMLILAWIPQTWDTIKKGYTTLHIAFITLYTASSSILMVYALFKNDLVFTILNGLLAIGSAINLFYKCFPRHRQ